MKISIIVLPLFSIPFLKTIISSISRQSYSRYEVIIIDGSGIATNEIIDSMHNASPWVTIISKTGDGTNPILQAFHKSSGDLIWIVDCPDEFHPDKFNLLVNMFSADPSIGGIRNSFVWKKADHVYHSIKTVSSVVDLADILSGDSVQFSDGVFRREWIEKFFANNSLPESCSLCALPLYFYTLTLLAGCRIIGLNQAANSRRKTVMANSNIRSENELTIHCLDTMFADPEVASPIEKWREKVKARAFLYGSIKAFSNGETELGQNLFRSSIQLDRSILDDGALTFFRILAELALQEGEAIDKLMSEIICRLSPEFAWMSQYLDESIARGYFYRAVDAIAFGRLSDGDQSISQANAYGMNLTELDMIEALRILFDHEVVYGFEAVKPAMNEIVRLSKFVDPQKISWVRSTWFINQAFAKFKREKHKVVVQGVLNALLISPVLIFNRGVISIFFKSLFQIIKNYSSKTKEVG